jgi:hypothetical protein
MYDGYSLNVWDDSRAAYNQFKSERLGNGEVYKDMNHMHYQLCLTDIFPYIFCGFLLLWQGFYFSHLKSVNIPTVTPSAK